MKTALLVMDLQEIVVGKKPFFFFHYRKDLLKQANKLIEQAHGKTVVYIRMVMKDNFVGKICPIHYRAKDPKAQLASGLKIVSDHVFDRYEGDAFTNPELDKFLKKQGIGQIEVFGVDGSGCVYNTIKGALKHGYKVKLFSEATDSTSRRMMARKFKELKELGAEII
jgi:nicotinamidase-related amidase